ncbi:MAG: sigma-54-dependent transcriptional regulator [bacterium]
MSYRVLIVDDDHLISRSICRYLESESLDCHAVYSGEDALQLLKNEEFDIVLLDLSLPGIDGFQTMKRVKADYPDIQIIILTSSQNLHDAIKAIKLGADDYLVKSTDIEELRITIKKAIKTYNLVTENILLKQLTQRFDIAHITIIESPKMKQVYQLVNKISKLENSTVLIMGESGTGKELVARTIHHLGPRADKPFIDISCSALPSSLMESELFGFEKGAFTDAKNPKKGLLELTDRGTLFLDEISTLDLSIQAKLLRFLEQRSFRRIGGTVDHKVDLRVIAATNRDLRKKIVSKEFREDLFYRLNVFPITIPPLRERKEDIIPLANCFIERFNREFHKNIKSLHQESIPLLHQYIYPGNVRELKNIIERAMIMEENDSLTPSSLHFPREDAFFAEPITTEPAYCIEKSKKENDFGTLAEMEKKCIREVLRRAGGNKTLAAKLLGIGRSTLFRKLEFIDKT